jgi:hypothetical protein
VAAYPQSGTTSASLRADPRLETDESDVIPFVALDSFGSARCGSLNTAVRQSAMTFVARAI